MSKKIETLASLLQQKLSEQIVSMTVEFDEITIEVLAINYLVVAQLLRDDAELAFDQAVDLSGIDYSYYHGWSCTKPHFAAVTHLLSLPNNWRLRLRCFAENNQFPILDSLTKIWPSLNWFEREAFDMYGILFSGHDDLRRILTDYGFVGHPLRKDFPTSGYVEMRYDPEQERVIYQPVSIEPRENTPRIIRERKYGKVNE